MDQTKPKALKRLHHQQKQRKLMTVRQALHFLCWFGGKIISWAILLNLCCASIEHSGQQLTIAARASLRATNSQIQTSSWSLLCILWCTQVYSVVHPSVFCISSVSWCIMRWWAWPTDRQPSRGLVPVKPKAPSRPQDIYDSSNSKHPAFQLL